MCCRSKHSIHLSETTISSSHKASGVKTKHTRAPGYLCSSHCPLKPHHTPFPLFIAFFPIIPPYMSFPKHTILFWASSCLEILLSLFPILFLTQPHGELLFILQMLAPVSSYKTSSLTPPWRVVLSSALHMLLLLYRPQGRGPGFYTSALLLERELLGRECPAHHCASEPSTEPSAPKGLNKCGDFFFQLSRTE